MIDLIITDYDTIKSKDRDSLKERSINEFLSKLEKGIRKQCNFSVEYNLNQHCFQIEFEGVFYKVDMDIKLIKNYEMGRYNQLTFKLKELADLSNAIKMERERRNERENENYLLASSIETTGKVPSEKSRAVYIERLRNQLKFDIKNYFLNLWQDLSSNYKKIRYKVWPYNELDAWEITKLSASLSFFTVCIGAVIGLVVSSWLVFGIIAAIMIPINIIYPLAIMVSTHIKLRSKRLIERLNFRKITKFKLKSLEKKADNTRFFQEELMRMDEKEMQSRQKLHLNTMKQINDLILLLDHVGQEDKKKFAHEIQGLLESFAAKFSQIMKQEAKKFDMKAVGDFEKLNLDITNQISAIELKIGEAIRKEDCLRHVEEDAEAIQNTLSQIVQEPLKTTGTGAQMQLRKQARQ